ncbi:MAG: SusC/RagA family TonB-linked outer membrane protein, partial [Cyclobacteriaceae bacterium]
MKNLIPYVIFMTKLFTYALMFQSLTMSFLFANDSKAQVKDIEEVMIRLDFEKSKVEKAFSKIEELTGFNFVYRSEELTNIPIISINSQNQSVYKLLQSISEQTVLEFKQVNNNIHVRLRDNLADQNPTQEDIFFISVTGTVTDEEGEPLPGVTVIVEGTTSGTVTDIDGKYAIEVSEEDALVFSFVGFESQRREVGNNSVINISLAEDAANLDEVVVVGYGTQKKVNVIGSLTTVSSDDITAAPVGAISNALAGRLPGAIFMQESGEPGNDQANIRIRGNATLGNNSPLIVIDGILGRDLNSLHPDDIESITVLKDAAAAIYGARAANGVILVTTKRGKADMPTKVNYSFYAGLLSPTMLPEMADAPTYATMIRENQSYRGVDESNMLFSEEDVEKFRSGAYPWTHPNTDWYGEALRDFSTTQHHNISVTGGGEKVSYFTSFGTQVDDGIYTNSNLSYKRYNMRANVDFRVNEYLTLGLDLTGIQEDRRSPGVPTSNMFRTIRRMYPTNPALFP